MSSGSPKVFISYRREETAGHAGRLYDVMSSRFGESNVFMDVDIAPGVDFVERIKDAVGRCHVLLVIIGPRWAAPTPGGSLPRIFEPEDFVRLEVETGVRRSDVAVIPVLVGGAQMPDPTSLPAPLRALTRRNAIEVSDSRWRYDVDRLLAALSTLLKDTSAVHQRAEPPARAAPARAAPVPAAPARLPITPAARTPSAGPPDDSARFAGVLLAVSTTVVAALTAVAGRAVANGLRWNPDTDRGKVLQPVALQALTWAVAGAAVALWLSIWLRKRGTGFGPLFLGAFMGALAGGVGAATSNVPDHLLDSPDETVEWLGVLGVAVTGAVIGALIAWVWRRRGSAGLAMGLLSGALVGLIQKGTSSSSSEQRVQHAFVQALVIVGVVTITQMLLDAWEARSPHGADPGRRALT